MATPECSVELLLDCKAQVGEAPFYDSSTHQLIWVDIRGQTINHLDVETGQNKAVKLHDTVGAAIPVEGSETELVALVGKDICLVNRETGMTTKVLATVDEDKPDNRFNDAKCDGQGRLWCGTMERILRWEGSKPVMPTPDMGALYSYGPGKLTKHISNLTISNGMGWSLDNRKMYFIDSGPKKVYAFDYDLQEGTLSNQSVLVDYAQDDGLGVPDGMCVDAEGRLWVCGFYGPGVTCFDPDTGELLLQISVPVYNVTSCCFGGPNFEWLFVTSACFATDEKEWKQFPHSGGIFVVKNLGTKGLPANRFKQ